MAMERQTLRNTLLRDAPKGRVSMLIKGTAKQGYYWVRNGARQGRDVRAVVCPSYGQVSLVGLSDNTRATY